MDLHACVLPAGVKRTPTIHIKHTTANKNQTKKKKRKVRLTNTFENQPRKDTPRSVSRNAPLLTVHDHTPPPPPYPHPPANPPPPKKKKKKTRKKDAVCT